MRPRVISLLAAVCAFGAVAAAPAVANATYVHWNSAVRVDRSTAGGLSGVSCPWTNLCAAVDQSGYLVTTTNPAKGRWNAPVRIESSSEGGLTAISCPTTKLCVAVDQSGNVLTSTTPAGGARYWSRPVRIDTDTAPGGGYAGLSAISCSSATLCAAVDQDGEVFTSTDPTGGAAAWTGRKLGGVLNAVSCAYKTSFCVVGGNTLYWASAAASASATWHAAAAPQTGGAVVSVACPGVSMCVGAGFADAASGFSIASSTPKVASSWATGNITDAPPLTGEGVIDAVSCASHAFCVAVDGYDNAYTSSQPAAGTWGGAGAVRPRSTSFTSAIACNPKQCVVVDSAGVATTGIIR